MISTLIRTIYETPSLLPGQQHVHMQVTSTLGAEINALQTVQLAAPASWEFARKHFRSRIGLHEPSFGASTATGRCRLAGEARTNAWGQECGQTSK